MELNITDDELAEATVDQPVEREGWFKGTDVAKLLNAELTERGLKNVPTQFVYNYMRKGYLPNDNLRVHAAVVRDFIVKQIAARLAAGKFAD